MKKEILLLLLFVLTGCDSDSNSINSNKMHGIWYGELTQHLPNGSLMSYKGTSEYFGNGSCNAMGQYILSISEQEYTYLITYNVILTSNWSIHGNSLIEKVIDLKSFPIIFQRGTIKIDLKSLSHERRQEIISSLPDFQSFIPNGMTIESKIINITNERVVLSTPDGRGGEVEYVVQRVKAPFQFDE